MLEQNKGILRGELKGGWYFDYERNGEAFYKSTLLVKRLSETVDEVSLSVSEKVLDNSLVNEPEITVEGSFRSRNQLVGDKSTLQLYFFVENITNEIPENSNLLELEGWICKEPSYRLTPLNREITDLLVAVNRYNRKSDYLPCIAWGRNASWLKHQQVGTKVKISGRIQSRKYTKQGDSESNTRTAYEISVSRITKID